MSFLSNFLLTLWLGFLAAAAIECHRAPDLGDIKGLEPQPKSAAPDVLDRLEQSIWHRTSTLELSEADVNHYLAASLAGRQEGLSKRFVKFERVALNFLKPDPHAPGLCRVWLFWLAEGRPCSVSLDFTVTRRKQEFVVELQRGTFGRLPVFRGALAALLPGLRSLCGALEEEIHAVFQMNQIRFEKNKVVLDPRFDVGE